MVSRSGSAATAMDGQHVGPMLDGLVEVADVARDVLVALDGEGDHRLRGGVLAFVRWSESGEQRRAAERGRGTTHDPAEGEPGMRLDDMAAEVAAVAALEDHALVAGQLLAEGVLSAHEEEEHGGGTCGHELLAQVRSVGAVSGGWTWGCDVGLRPGDGDVSRWKDSRPAG